MDSINLNVRVYPLDEPKGKTLAYANIIIDNIAAVKSLRIVNGQNGLFVTMPQSRDRRGIYHDIAFPLNRELRDLITNSVLDEFENQSKLPPGERGYEDMVKEPGRSLDVRLDTKVFLIKQPKGDTLAFANVGFNDAFVIRGIRIQETDKGRSIAMPQTKDKEGSLRDVAYPLSGDLRVRISKLVLDEFENQLEDREQGIEEKFSGEAGEDVQSAQTPGPQPSMGETSPGLGV